MALGYIDGVGRSQVGREMGDEGRSEEKVEAREGEAEGGRVLLHATRDWAKSSSRRGWIRGTPMEKVKNVPRWHRGGTPLACSEWSTVAIGNSHRALAEILASTMTAFRSFAGASLASSLGSCRHAINRPRMVTSFVGGRQ